MAARSSPRVALDANILIAGIRFPRWPYEVVRAAVMHRFRLVLPDQVVEEARRHLTSGQQTALELILILSEYEPVQMPPLEALEGNADLVRSKKDVPIALALLGAEVDIFVTNDRDFTDRGATSPKFAEQVRVLLAAVFLRDILGWTPDRLEAIRYRTWDEFYPVFPT
jgi:rRNA-processing protein FCF1